MDEVEKLTSELRDEGWFWISRVAGDEWLTWLHEPSRRSVSAQRWGSRDNITCSPDFGPYAVLCQRRDEGGAPYEGDVVGPFDTLAKAVAFARRARLSILLRPTATMVEQAELFGAL